MVWGVMVLTREFDPVLFIKEWAGLFVGPKRNGGLGLFLF